MRLQVVAAGLIFSTVFFVAGSSPAHAQQSQNNSTQQSKVVKVQAGDYLAKIAAENNTTYPRLYDANLNIKDPDIIFPGESLRVPAPNEKLPSRAAPEDKAPAAPVKATSQAPAAKPVPKTKAQPRTVQPKPNPAPVAYSSDGSVWDRLAQCESGGNWSINTGNGYYGGLQFSLASWRGVGGSGYPHQASRAEQISRAEALKARQGWGAWPACSSKLGLR